MTAFLKAIDLLPVTLPVTVKYSHKDCQDAVAYYHPIFNRMGQLRGHKITVYMPTLAADTRNVDTILAHELIHAWQEEKGYNEIHGKQFAKMAVKLSAHLGLRGIFDPTIDKP